jgi:hypothetical protein
LSDADDIIARFIAERGVTRCPTVYLVETQAAKPGKQPERLAPLGFKWAGKKGRYFRALLDKPKNLSP